MTTERPVFNLDKSKIFYVGTVLEFSHLMKVVCRTKLNFDFMVAIGLVLNYRRVIVSRSLIISSKLSAVKYIGGIFSAVLQFHRFGFVWRNNFGGFGF